MPAQTLLLLVLVLLYCCSSGAFASAGAGGAVDPHLGMHPHRIDARYWLPVGASTSPVLRCACVSSAATVAKGTGESCFVWLPAIAAQSVRREHRMTARLFISQPQCHRTYLTSVTPSSRSGACTATSRSAGVLPVGGVLQGLPPPFRQHQRCACLPGRSPSALFSLCSGLIQPGHPQVLVVRQGALVVNHDTCDTNAVGCTAAASAAENGVSEALLPPTLPPAASSAAAAMTPAARRRMCSSATTRARLQAPRRRPPSYQRTRFAPRMPQLCAQNPQRLHADTSVAYCTAAGSSAPPSVISEDQVCAEAFGSMQTSAPCGASWKPTLGDAWVPLPCQHRCRNTLCFGRCIVRASRCHRAAAPLL